MLSIIDPIATLAIYGRFTVAERNEKGKLIIQRWVRRALGWRGKAMTRSLWEQKLDRNSRNAWLRGHAHFALP